MSATVEIIGEVRHETDHAVLLYDGRVEEWIPKSQISDRRETTEGLVELDVPEWLAHHKGLI